MLKEIIEYKFYFFFFFKQKTAYEITYGDWSSDVCSSDLLTQPPDERQATHTLLGSPHALCYNPCHVCTFRDNPHVFLYISVSCLSAPCPARCRWRGARPWLSRFRRPTGWGLVCGGSLLPSPGRPCVDSAGPGDGDWPLAGADRSISGDAVGRSRRAVAGEVVPGARRSTGDSLPCGCAIASARGRRL